jgi:hypothetical protein
MRGLKMYKINELIGQTLSENSAFLVDVIRSKQLIIANPITKIETFAQQSVRIGMNNVVTFSDNKGANVWYLIQLTQLIDGYVVGDYSVNLNEKPDVTKAIRFIKENQVNQLDGKLNGRVEGVIVSQTRPYHFMYDQYVHLFSQVNKGLLDYAFTDETCFLDKLPNGKSLQKAQKNQCYLFPTIQAGCYTGEAAIAMNHYLTNQAENIKSEGLVLWFGITGQKRSWLEQVEGCIALSKEILKYYSHLTLIIDGWTSYHGEGSYTQVDHEVLDQIKHKANGIKGINVVNIIDKDYISKIAYAKIVDYFVVNDGTGALIPYSVCRKKGITHGVIDTFKRINSSDIKRVPESKITTEKNKIMMNNSYSFSWTIIYNLLVSLGLKGKIIEEETIGAIPSKLIFSKMAIKAKAQPADILRDIALKFEQSGDINTALALMLKAKEQRPEGPLIREKCELYQEFLLNTHQEKNDNNG